MCMYMYVHVHVCVLITLAMEALSLVQRTVPSSTGGVSGRLLITTDREREREGEGGSEKGW